MQCSAAGQGVGREGVDGGGGSQEAKWKAGTVRREIGAARATAGAASGQKKTERSSADSESLRCHDAS